MVTVAVTAAALLVVDGSVAMAVGEGSVAFQAATTVTPSETGATYDVTVVLTVAGAGTLTNELTVEVHDAASTAAGTATSGTDYTALSPDPTVLTFAAGTADGATQTVGITVVADSVDEADETVELELKNVTGTGNTLGAQATHTLTITDDDTAGVTVTESGGTTDVIEAGLTDTYDVVLTSQPTADVTITVAAGADATALPSPLTFTAGDWFTPQTVTVTAVDDTWVEGAHTQLITHTAASADPNYSGISIADVTANITDNDTATVEFTTTASSIGEAAGPALVEVTLNVSAGASLESAVTADVSVTGGTASGSGVDYTFTSPQTVTFIANSSDGTTQNVTVTIVDDGDHEADETIDLSLSVTGGPASLGANGSHTVTITDDDDVLVAFSLAASPAGEPDVANVDVEITFTGGGTLQGDVTVDVIDLGDGSATTPADYTFTSPTTLKFLAGSASGTIQTAAITVAGDLIDETDETIHLSLENVTGRAALGAQGTHTVTITDNDDALVSIDDVSVAEGDTGQAAASFTVSLSTPAAFDITLDYTTADGTATAGADYTTAAGSSFTIPAGTTSTPIDVMVTGDTVDEADETFTVDLTGISTGQGDISGTGTILDDDGAPTLSVSATDADRPEAAAGSPAHIFTFTVRLLPASGQTVTVDYTTADGTATAGADYVAKAGTLTFTPGQTSKTVTVTVVDDAVDEPAETFFVNLSGETNAVVDTAQATGTIRDDDNVAPAHDRDCGPGGSFICFFVRDGAGNATVEFDPGETVHVSGDFSDPGATDIHSVTVDWGDGTGPETTVLPVGTRSYEVTHRYFAGGTFTLTLELADGDGGNETLTGPILVPIFTDIANSVHKDNIITIWVKGVTQGCNPPDDTLYCPADFVTRAQMATFLVRVLGLIPWPDDGPFTDHIASVHRQNINAIRVAGITTGCAPTLYCPGDFVTRAQMATFIARALALPPTATDYFDDDGTSPHQANINAFAEAGITAGCGVRLYCPADFVTRAQMATFLANVLAILES